MSKPLIIVESPTKARTIAGYLGPGFVVESSMGHVRDLPRNAAEVPEKHKGDSWARLGVNVEEGFAPLYIVPQEKRDRIRKLKGLLADAEELYLATDEDREGESIAWHLAEVLKPKVPVRRMVFHEITPAAIRRALEEPRDIDRLLVEAQETRRTLDRLYGYEVSPVLWKKIRPKLSAGRVQSVAVRILVERERERIRFRSAGYWDIKGIFSTRGEMTARFGATLVTLDGTRLATGKDFDELGRLRTDDTHNLVVLDEAAARELVGELGEAIIAVTSVERKPYRRSPYPPFRTSTLQQEAGRKLRFPAAKTMSVAQRLYENGYITYMRTDSTSLSEAAVAAARSHIAELFGAEYLPDRPRSYANKVKNAQEAHEAIRPAGEQFHPPDSVARAVGADEARLYELIWQRTMASQMRDAVGETVSVRLGGRSSRQRSVEFATSGRIITFPGFLRAYVAGSDDPEAELDDQERRLPPVAAGDQLDMVALEAAGHETRPPARYTEASLVSRLEELGVGRPSTYASILSTIQERGYVFKKGTALVPSWTAFATVSLLEDHFPRLVDYDFTKEMEDDLDEIADGRRQRVPWLTTFYSGEDGLRDMIHDRLEGIDARQVNSFPIGTDDTGAEVVVRVGRYGPYLQRGDDTASIPDDLAPDELTLAAATELLAVPSGDKILGTDADSGLAVLARTGRFGPYVQLGEQQDGAKTPPKRESLFTTMSLDSVTLDDAVRLLSLPRLVGESNGIAITARNGRYGPYLKKGDETRSLGSEEQIFAVTLDEAEELFAQPKRRRGQGGAATLRELGADPASGKPVVLRSGRYGPYVTDGETNVSLRPGDDPEAITLERAAELLQARRDRGPAKTPVRRRKR